MFNLLFAIWKESEEFSIIKFREEVIDAPLFLRRCRERLGMSKAEIAAIVGASVRTYSNYEIGRSTEISVSVFLHLCRLNGWA